MYKMIFFLTYILLYRNGMENDELNDVQEDNVISMLYYVFSKTALVTIPIGDEGLCFIFPHICMLARNRSI